MIYRTDKNNDRFTRVSNGFLRDERLSLKSKGLLALCLSESDDWNFTVSGLAAFCRDKESAVSAAMDELEACGYLVRGERVRDEHGRLKGRTFDFYEQPQQAGPSPAPENTYLGKSLVGETPTWENSSVENTYLENSGTKNDYIFKNDKKKKESAPPKNPKHKYGLYNNVLLSDNDMSKLMEEFPNDYEQRIERLSEYIASTGKTYKNHLATIRSWARRDAVKKAAEQPPERQFVNFSELDGEGW